MSNNEDLFKDVVVHYADIEAGDIDNTYPGDSEKMSISASFGPHFGD